MPDMYFDIVVPLFCYKAVNVFRNFKHLLTACNILIIKAFLGINCVRKVSDFHKHINQLKNWLSNSSFCLFRLERGKELLSHD